MEKSFKKLYEAQILNRKKCPWAKERTIQDYAKHVLLEAQEIVLAVENDDMDNLKEEMGDVMLNLLFLGVLAEEEKLFTVEEIIEQVTKKIKSRKPWVYSDMKGIDTPEKAIAEWMKIKKIEKEKKNIK